MASCWPAHRGRLSARLGVQPQRPQHRALEQHPAAVRRWLTTDDPAIRAQARREGGVVLWPLGAEPPAAQIGAHGGAGQQEAIALAGQLGDRITVHTNPARPS